MPTIPEALAVALQHHQAGRLKLAEQLYRQILQVEPNHADALHFLGVVACQVGRYEDALDHISRAIGVRESTAGFHYNLGKVYEALSRLPEAVASYRRALALEPRMAEAHNNLGLGLATLGNVEEAMACYRRALDLKPKFPEAHNNLGNACKDQGKLEEALLCYRRALELNADYAEAYSNLGNAYLAQGKLDEATHAYRRAVELDPRFAEAHNNLGTAYKDQGRIPEAVACYRRAIELKPGFTAAHSNLIYSQLFLPGGDPKELAQELDCWQERHAAPLASSFEPHLNEASPDRPLRIGYLSPDFRDHVVGRNMLPLFREHDRRQFEIYCYSNCARPDAMTAQFRNHAAGWREISHMRDAELARCIREDRIDLLVDLALHLGGNRLTAMARRPAPMQVTFAGYPGSTGLAAIDYRLTDPHLDPPGLQDECYTEKSIRLPASFWCYDPISQEPEVSSLPAAQNGYVTFGCLNNFCKLNADMLKLWARIFRAAPGSQLMLCSGEGSHRLETLDFLGAEGVNRGRVTFVEHQPRKEYLRYYRSIDIGLDTAPYNGHTTSLDSFWMGAPVVTLVGKTVVGRAGLSQLMNLGLPELIAFNPEQYVQIAIDLTRDLARLAKLRSSLRDRMQASPLTDAPRFARGIEAAYREMWQGWCKAQRL